MAWVIGVSGCRNSCPSMAMNSSFRSPLATSPAVTSARAVTSWIVSNNCSARSASREWSSRSATSPGASVEKIPSHFPVFQWQGVGQQGVQSPAQVRMFHLASPTS